MRITVEHAHDDKVLAQVTPGDEINIRAMVEAVEVETLDVTAFGKPPQAIPGVRTVRLVIVEVTK